MLLGCVWFRCQNQDFWFAIEREIWKRISTLRYLFLDFHFYRSIGKSEKGFEKLSLRTAVLHAHAYLAKRRPLFTRIVLQILFRISQSNGKKEIHKISKSTMRTDLLEVKSVFGFRFRLQNLKSLLPVLQSDISLGAWFLLLFHVLVSGHNWLYSIHMFRPNPRNYWDLTIKSVSVICSRDFKKLCAVYKFLFWLNCYALIL